jgi:hypothetical protein
VACCRLPFNLASHLGQLSRAGKSGSRTEWPGSATTTLEADVNGEALIAVVIISVIVFVQTVFESLHGTTELVVDAKGTV